MNRLLKTQSFQHFRAWLKPVAAFALPLLPLFTILALAIDLLVSFFEGRLRKKYKLLLSTWLILPMAFYLLHVAGLLWTSNYSFALLDLKIKLSLLFIPLVFFLNPPSRKIADKSLFFFTLGTFVASVIMLSAAALKFAHNPDKTYFFYVSLSSSIHFHPTFISVYLNITLIYLALRITELVNLRIIKMTLVCLLIFIVNAAALALLSAKMAEIAACISLLLCVIFYLRMKDRPRNVVPIMVVLSLVMICFTITAVEINNRFRNVDVAVTSMEHPNLPQDNTSGESTAARMQIWKNGWILFTENFLFGTGTGDIKDELKKVYAKNNFQTGIDRNYSPHNQYLQTGSALGITGLLVLLMLLFLPAYQSWHSKLPLPFMFLFILSVNLLAESMLEVQAGVLFTGFFYGLFFSTDKP